MDIRKPEWKNRYLALTKGKTFHRLSPAIEEFFMAEVELFDVSLCNLSVTHSKLEDLIQDTRSRIADPIFSLWRFKEVNIPDVEEVVRTTKLEVEKLESSLYKILEQNPGVSSNEIETVLVPEKDLLPHKENPCPLADSPFLLSGLRLESEERGQFFLVSFLIICYFWFFFDL